MTVRDPKFDGPLGKVHLVWKVAETLGWRWVVTRLVLEAERRSGMLERRTPISRWDQWPLDGGDRLRVAPLHTASAGRFLAGSGPGVEGDLRQHLERLKERRFDLFGTEARIDSWHDEPLSPASYPPGQHWSRVRELPHADLKLIWEPSRFAWVYDLCRLHALDPDTAAPDVFWSLFEDWCEHNQPNAGVNWQCGQEAALRLMAVVFAVFTFGPERLDEDRRRLLACFADATAKRILAHWRYAKSQDNNHIVSEAVGLLTVALVFPDLAVSPRARATGAELLDDACRRLVFPDGGTSQYSLNYHRVFMENFIWALWLHRSMGAEAPAELEPALRRTRDFLVVITQKSDGAAGNWGNDDKAHLLPLASTRHLDVRPTLLMAAQLLDGATYDWGGPAEEAVRWFWGEPVRHLPNPPEPEGVWTKIFPYAGISIIVNGSHRALIRGGEHQLFRPPQCDFGHVELWVDGEQVVFDLGTSSYKPRPGEPDYSETQWHNLPWPEGEQMMTRLGRFLWGDWPDVSVTPSPTGLGVDVRVSSRASTNECLRTVRSDEEGWVVAPMCGARSADTAEILICARHFPPAYRSGGPPRSLGGLVKALEGEFGFRVLTMATDRTDDEIMPGVTPNVWSSWGPAAVRYGTNPWRVAVEAVRACRRSGRRVVYLNSFFDVHFTLLPLIALRLLAPRTPVVLAPRGEFSRGALSLKPWRKSIYRAGLLRSGLLGDVIWQASTSEELVDIQREVGPMAAIVVAQNIRETPELPAGQRRPRHGTFRIAFLSRITRMKNLDGLIAALGQSDTEDLSLTIAGPVVDESYWTDCRRLTTELGLDDRVSYVGEIGPDEVVPFLSEFDLFALPTLGENFGHVILEALSAGTPVLVSDRTPWSAVSECGAGLIVDIEDPATIADAIDQIAALPARDHLSMRQRARLLGEAALDDADAAPANVELFREALAVIE